MQDDLTTAPSTRSKRSRTVKWAIIGAVCITLYAAVGFLVVPPILRSQLESILTKQLNHPVEVKEVRFNPFALSLTVRDLAVSEPDHSPLLGFEELYINLELASLINRAPTFSLIRLLHPYAVVIVRQDGTLNLADLHPSPADQPPEPPPSPEGQAEKPLPAVIVELLEHEGGILEFHDYARPTPFNADIVPNTFVLRHFTTMPDSQDALSFTAEIGSGEKIAWHGVVHLQPFYSEGTLALTGIKARTIWDYIQHLVEFEVTDGLIDLKADYVVKADREGFRASLKQGGVAITKLAMGEKDMLDPLILVPEFAVDGVEADLSSRQVRIAEVRSRDARINGWIDRHGRTSFQLMFAGDKRTKGPAQPPSPSPSRTAKPWEVNIDHVTVTEYGITMEDRKPITPVRLTVNPLTIKLADVSNKLDNKIALDLTARVNDTGTVAVKGDVIADPLTMNLDLTVDKIAFEPFQPYLDEIAQLNMKSGSAALKGRFSYRSKEGSQPHMRFEGKAAVADLLTQDKLLNKDFLKWKELAVNGIGLEVDPTRVAIAEIVLTKPYVRFIIGPNRTTNVQQVFATPDSDGLANEPAPEKPKAAKPSQQQPTPVQIDAVRLVDGSAHFADFSLKPVIDTGIFAMNGTIKGLSSKELSKADVSIAGKVDKYAPMAIKGTINPLTSDAFTDLAVLFKNVELTTASPYSTKFAGYPITKGKISIDLHYKLNKKILEAENKIVINQLTLGDRIENPDATSLPVKLAVALLKDRNGVIDIDLPIRGDLNDPDFKYGKALLGVLVNLLSKAATAPFNLIAGLAGGNTDELSVVEFHAGSGELTPAQEGHLKTVAKALMERPELRLEIVGSADAEADRAALTEHKLNRDLVALKVGNAKQTAGTATGSDDFASLPEDERTKLTKALYLKRFGKLPESQARAVPTQALRERLLENTTIDEEELRLLAQGRGKSIQDFLIAQGGIDPEHVFLLDAKLDAQAKDGIIASKLNVTAE